MQAWTLSGGFQGLPAEWVEGGKGRGGLSEVLEGLGFWLLWVLLESQGIGS